MKVDNPIIQAMKDRSKKQVGATPFDPLDEGRLFELQHDQDTIPGLPGKRVGEAMTVNLTGHVHSQHNGKTMMRVTSVKPDSDDMTEEENPDLKTPSESGAVSVRTQQSHA
jgi:hypothetical protein